MRFRLLVLILIPVGALTTMATAACGPAHEPAPVRLEPVDVPVATVERREIRLPHEATGTLRAEDTVVVAAKVLSHIDAVHVAAGQTVRRGELLVELDNREIVAAARQAQAARAEVEGAIEEARRGLELAQADLELATATHRRYAELLEKRSVSAQEYDEVSARWHAAQAAANMAEARQRQAESRHAQVEAQLEAAQVAVGHARITAPMNGTVTVTHLDAGSLATPGAPILTLERAGTLELVVAVPGALRGRLAVDQLVSVSIDDVGEEGRTADVTGRVAEVVQALDPLSRTFAVTIALPPDERLRSGGFGRARLPGPPRAIVTVPRAAVVERGQVQSVFVVENDAAHRRLVSLGSETDGRVEVLSGLDEGDRVVLEPAAVTDGQPVTVRGIS